MSLQHVECFEEEGSGSREAFDTSEANDLNTHACDLPLKQYHEMVNLHWGFLALLML